MFFVETNHCSRQTVSCAHSHTHTCTHTHTHAHTHALTQIQSAILTNTQSHTHTLSFSLSLGLLLSLSRAIALALSPFLSSFSLLYLRYLHPQVVYFLSILSFFFLLALLICILSLSLFPIHSKGISVYLSSLSSFLRFLTEILPLSCFIYSSLLEFLTRLTIMMFCIIGILSSNSFPKFSFNLFRP